MLLLVASSVFQKKNWQEEAENDSDWLFFLILKTLLRLRLVGILIVGEIFLIEFCIANA